MCIVRVKLIALTVQCTLWGGSFFNFFASWCMLAVLPRHSPLGPKRVQVCPNPKNCLGQKDTLTVKFVFLKKSHRSKKSKLNSKICRNAQIHTSTIKNSKVIHHKFVFINFLFCSPKRVLLQRLCTIIHIEQIP